MLRRFLIHSNGPVLWPEHKNLAEVIKLKETTPPTIWNATYQGSPTGKGVSIFQREWYLGQNRYDPRNPGTLISSIAHFQSWDTAMGDAETNAYSACVTGDLLPDYRLAIRSVWRDRLQFHELHPMIAMQASEMHHDGKLYGVIIEDKASGTSALQTLRAISEPWLATILLPFLPTTDKTSRANQASVWCKNGSILLPHPSEVVSWLYDFETELFSVPGSVFWDQVDAFSQLVLYLEPQLRQGYELRTELALIEAVGAEV